MQLQGKPEYSEEFTCEKAQNQKKSHKTRIFMSNFFFKMENLNQLTEHRHEEYQFSLINGFTTMRVRYYESHRISWYVKSSEKA